MRECVNQIFSLRTCFYYYLNYCDLEKKVLNMWDDPIYKTFYYTQIVSNQDYGIGFNDTTYIMMTWKGEFH